MRLQSSRLECALVEIDIEYPFVYDTGSRTSASSPTAIPHCTIKPFVYFIMPHDIRLYTGKHGQTDVQKSTADCRHCVLIIHGSCSPPEFRSCKTRCWAVNPRLLQAAQITQCSVGSGNNKRDKKARKTKTWELA